MLWKTVAGPPAALLAAAWLEITQQPFASSHRGIASHACSLPWRKESERAPKLHLEAREPSEMSLKEDHEQCGGGPEADFSGGGGFHNPYNC